MAAAQRAFLWAAAAAAVLTAATASPEEANCTKALRKICSSTLYPSLCFSSLRLHACADPLRLAHVAANVSIAHVSVLYSHVSALAAADGRAAAALADCEESLGDAVELSQQAAAEVALLRAARGADVAWHVSNAQTWLSAALTNEDTCADGVATWAGGRAVVRGVRRTRKYTSNALALVNRLVGARRRRRR
ncbi:pectinesterase 3-like [Wolffia australiana]